MKIIDLTCPLDFKYTPLHPIVKDVEATRKYTLKKDGYNITQMKIFTHSGTHIDVPFHMIENGKKLDEIPLENFFGNAIVLNTPKDELGEITAKDLEEALEKSKLEIYPGEMVLINTNWGKYYIEETKDSLYLAEKHPGLLIDAAEWLVKKKIKLVGIDVFSIRHPKLAPKITGIKPERVHTILLSNDILIVEQLVNLDKIANKKVKACFIPLPLKNMDGSPVRALAFLE
jgi:kynurenine formamidase